MPRISLHKHAWREQETRCAGQLQRPALGRLATGSRSPAHRQPADGLRSAWPAPTVPAAAPRSSPACCAEANADPRQDPSSSSSSSSPSSSSAAAGGEAGALVILARRRATLRAPALGSGQSGFCDGGRESECCGSSGRCSHGGEPSVGRQAGDGRWGRPLLVAPRELLVGAALAAPLCTAAASSAAEASADLAASAAAAVAGAGAAASVGVVDVTAAELAAAGVTSVVPPGYVPSPIEPGWEIWLGFVAGVVPFLIGSYEFGKRIIIQLRCEQCGGRGLVPSAGPGRDKYLRKCPQCGGFFPWISWKMFLSSTAAPGNGGPLQQPRGQTSVFYTVPDRPDPAKQAEALARSQGAVDASQARGQHVGQEQRQRGQQEPVEAEGGAAADPAAAAVVSAAASAAPTTTAESSPAAAASSSRPGGGGGAL